MRRVVLGMNVSLDGFVAGPCGEMDWQCPQVGACGVSFERCGNEKARLKVQPRAASDESAGATMARSLLEQGLVDELELTVHPVVLGGGIPLFALPMNLQLLDVRTLATGAVQVTYRPI